MSVKKSTDIPSTPIAAGEKTSFQMFIPPEEGPHFAMRKFTIQPGGSMPRHTNTVEHEQYVLNGSARVGIGDDVYQVQKDDIVFIPAGVPHWYETSGVDAFEFLCLIPNQEDIITILDDNAGDQQDA